jgi:predicted 2-oxoglutarate/Fe(II)-dependent dioxygenase YbiX
MGGKKKGGAVSVSKKATASRAAVARGGMGKRDDTSLDTVVPASLQFDAPRRPLQPRDLHGGGLIYAVPGFLSPAECRRVREFAEASGAFARVTQRASKYYAFRDNDRILLRMTAFAELLWTRLRPLVPAEYEGMHAVGLNPAMRFYRYAAGQRFGCHVDQSDVDPVTGHHSRFTVLVYLNDASDSALEGGETVFYGTERDAVFGASAATAEVLRVAPETGAALVHGHGDRCLLHEGALVTRGATYLLRSDVMYSTRAPR